MLSFLPGLAAGGLPSAYWTRPGGWLSFAHGHYYPYYGPPYAYYGPLYYPSDGIPYHWQYHQPYYLPYYQYYGCPW